jgi:hypothetical protein
LAGAASLQLECEGRIMMALVSATFRFQKIEPNPVNAAPTERGWQHLWSGIVKWLTEPIPFPAEWPVIDSQRERYNKEAELKSGKSDELEIDER